MSTSVATNNVTMWLIRIACWISKAICTYDHARMCKHAHTDQYVVLIAFQQQPWFRARASMLRYMYSACLVNTCLWPAGNCINQ
jgi:hypothetical protein